MPELPEVETVVRDLRPLVVGQRVEAIWVGRKKLRRTWQRAWTASILGTTVEAVRRRGKWIVIALNSGGRIVVHLGMTGQLTVKPSNEPRPTHTHVVFGLASDVQLRFRDARRFGSVEWFPDEETVHAYLARKLGPEPTDLDAAEFRQSIRRTGRALKAVLLDQAVVAGVGNIYADESLHRAGLHPERCGVTVTDTEADRLREAMATVVAEAIEHRGSTIRDYVGGAGQRGGYQTRFRVYGRGGEGCRACGAAIEVIRVAGRSSHFCPACQPADTREERATTARGQSRIIHRPTAPEPRRT